MTTLTSRTAHPASSSSLTATPAQLPAGNQTSRREHRARDFGVGYGSSSGYASGRRYAANWGNPRFVCG